jgi:hypothetical protein
MIANTKIVGARIRRGRTNVELSKRKAKKSAPTNMIRNARNPMAVEKAIAHLNTR